MFIYDAFKRCFFLFSTLIKKIFLQLILKNKMSKVNKVKCVGMKSERSTAKYCVYVLMEGWLLVSCSCSSSSIQEVMKEFSAAAGEGTF